MISSTDQESWAPPADEKTPAPSPTLSSQAPWRPPASEAVEPAQGAPEAAITANKGQGSGPDWLSLYGGLDGLDLRVSADQKAAFASLDKTSQKPKETRAKVINQSYLREQMPDLPASDLDRNWQAIKDTYAKEKLGVDAKDITDERLYGYIQANLQDEADPKGFKGFTGQGPEHWDTAPMTNFGGEVDVSKIKDPTAYVAASVWNGIQPALSSMSSPESIASMGGAGALAKSSEKMAKPVLGGIAGLFGALMAKNGIEALPEVARTFRDPNASTGDKIKAVTADIVDWLMAFGAVYGAGKQFAPPLQGTIPQAASALQQAATAAPLDAMGHLRAAADKLTALAKAAPGVVRNSEAGQAWDEVKQILAPASRGPLAEKTAGSLREHGGTLARRTDIAEAALKAASKVLMKMPVAQRWQVVDDIEAGRPQATRELQGFADAVRTILDTKRAEIQALGTGKLEHFIEDYFPHIWKDPEDAAKVLKQAVGKAPLEGAKSFLKQRTIPTIKEGMALGLEPATDSPVEMVLLRAREMDKYILAQKWMQEMKDKGLAKLVRSGDEPPEGWLPINDKIATVYGPRQGVVSFGPNVNTLSVTPDDVTVHGQRIMGKYYAPGEVATVANNYLSPGLRKYATFRAYLALANSMNQFQLGLSAFHLGFVSLDTSVSKLSLAIEQAAGGKFVEAAKSAAQVATAPFTTAIQGNRVLAEWSRPGTHGAEIAKIADAYMKGGGRAKQDQFYQNGITKQMLAAFGQKTVGGAISGAWRLPFAAIEQVSKPLMSWLVPRMKAGVAADMMRLEMDKLGPNATEDQLRAAFGKVVNSVDNRMGQMVYDNLFWRKSVKDLLMASVRSVGWNLGTIRELGGGVKDLASFAKDTLTPKKKAEFTHRMGYLIALPVLTGMIGGMYQYLRTGKKPEDLRDLYFPKTGEQDPQGRDVRLALPSYMKDVYHYPHDPVGTIEGKVNPFPSLVMEMLNNKDFFGRDIRNADDPFMQQLKQEAEFITKGYEPIGIKQFEVSKAAGVSKGEEAANFVGVTRAPAWIGETDAEQLAGKLAGDAFKGSGTPDAERVQQIQNAKQLMRSGKQEQADAILDGLEDAEQLTPVQRRNIEKGTEHTYLENAVSHLGIDSSEDHGSLWRVFKVATPKERAAIGDLVQKRIDKAHIPEEEREKLQEQFDKLMPPDQDNLYR